MRARYLLAFGILVAAVAADHLFTARPVPSGPAALQAILDARADAPKPEWAVTVPAAGGIPGAAPSAPILDRPATPSLVLGVRRSRPVPVEGAPQSAEEPPSLVDGESAVLVPAEIVSVPATGAIRTTAPSAPDAPEPSPSPAPVVTGTTSLLSVLEPLLVTAPESAIQAPEPTPTGPIASEPVPDPSPTPAPDATTSPRPRRTGSPSDANATPLIDLSS
ncbi:MAG: hypothetical protein ACRDJ4_08200 [Actinomycetota bacterium]